MASRSDIAGRFDSLLARLLTQTGASRTTLRIDWPPLNFHVDDVAGEAHGDGIKSLRGETSIDQRAVPTVKWLAANKTSLIQADLHDTDVPAPPALLSIYGVFAQMLAPIVDGESLLGWVSVHECAGTRPWTQDDIRHLDEAVEAVNDILQELKQAS